MRDFKAHFLGTHFFNPPRYMKLLELIPTPDTDPTVVADITQFAEDVLGKGVVMANDTPNFIGNRLAFIPMAKTFEYAIAEGYTIPEVDLLTGPLVGRPKTGTFRLADLVGIDIMAHIANNLYDLLPHDAERQALKTPEFSRILGGMVERNWLGNKTQVGFSQTVRGEGGKKDFWPLNFETLSMKRWTNPALTAWARSDNSHWPNDCVAWLPPTTGQASSSGLSLSRTLAYAAAIMPEVSDDVMAVDNAMKWGFIVGGRAVRDLGYAGRSRDCRTHGSGRARNRPRWVKEMLESGAESFYRSVRWASNSAG